jgi:hypothetical protein
MSSRNLNDFECGKKGVGNKATAEEKFALAFGILLRFS